METQFNIFAASASESVREIWLHMNDFTRKRMIGKLEEGRTVTSVAAEFEINKSVVSRTWEAFQTTGTAVNKVGGGRPRTTTAGDDRCIILQAKRGADSSQQAPLLSNSVQQRGDKCRGLLWPDAFTKGAYSHAVLNVASR
ncbi:uncharacterized protein TNCV_1308401 [Trichonephila clavipes]|nr:uncharacterized protein TNCV_1308401 [Trichonephila clavipes]